MKHIIYIFSIFTFLNSVVYAEGTGIGYKGKNLILLDLGKYQNNCLFLAQASGEATAPATENLTIKKPNKSWMITEPLAGFAVGMAGEILLFSMASLIGGVKSMVGGDEGGNPYISWVCLIAGKSFGAGGGIYFTGKYIEKEKGSLIRTLVWSTIGSVVEWFTPYYMLPILSTTFGLISYRTSVK